ncbi:glycosyltransferase family 2 protein [Devosia sp.]|uniref:glycosyltransferase family 2 protein n=1 Tax=Devosia sp. TaxID=1871048 RepID=UPI002FC7F89B
MRSTGPQTARVATPLISVVMANYQAGDKLVPAMESVLRQSVGDLELIVCDDASGDHSVALVEQFMRADPRVSLISAKANGGPARCRNRGLGAARGQWIAVVDADDIIHPERFERLLAAAAHRGAGIVADDLLHFYEDGSPVGLLLGADQDRLFSVTTEQWVGAGVDGSPALGYLKPLIRADVLGALRYDENLRIGEDYDLVLRLLLAGAAMVVLPEPYYLYRRHSGSISHRLSVADLAAMIDSQDAVAGQLGALSAPLAAAFAARHAQLRRGLAFERLVAAIKSRNLGLALSLLARDPRLAPRLWRAFLEGRRWTVAVPAAGLSPAKALQLGPSGLRVPDYVPVSDMDWTSPRPRRAWHDLADLARGQPIDVICPDKSSRYAAGFIPLARLREPVAKANLQAQAS